MKVLATLVLMTFAGLSQALAEDLTYDWPSVNGLKINTACATAKTFRSLKPTSYCVETKVQSYACKQGEVEACRPLQSGQLPAPGERLKENVSCIAYGQRNFEVPRVVKTERCVESAPISEASYGECLRWGQVETFMGVDFLVSTYREQAEAGPVFAGHKKYTIPACQ